MHSALTWRENRRVPWQVVSARPSISPDCSYDGRILIDEDEGVAADGDEEVSSDKSFHIFHYLVRMTELFASWEIRPSIVAFVVDSNSRYRTVM